MGFGMWHWHDRAKKILRIYEKDGATATERADVRGGKDVCAHRSGRKQRHYRSPADFVMSEIRS